MKKKFLLIENGGDLSIERLLLKMTSSIRWPSITIFVYQ